MIKIIICNKEYQLSTKSTNLLNILTDIKQNINNKLTFRSGCRSGVCGCCAVRVNGIEKLACKTNIKENDKVEPLKNCTIIKDLIVDNKFQVKLLSATKTFLDTLSEDKISNQDVIKIDKQSNCILCNACYSSCPVYETNQNFIGPFSLNRAFRYIEDKKELKQKTIIDNIQENGVFDCTLCGNCSMVCPIHIDIKNDIIKLQNKSVQYGHANPMFSNNNMDFELQF